MQTPDDFARAIDAASDAGDEALLRQLAVKCEERLNAADHGPDRVLLRYYQSNTYSAIIETKYNDSAYLDSWDQPEGIRNLLSLRHAINESAFGWVNPIISCQIRTNLANRLHTLGRPIAANEQWVKALGTIPRFAKALASQARGMTTLARTLYDEGHTSVLLAAARSLYDKALDEDALWESGDRDSFAPGLTQKRNQVADYLVRNRFDEESDLNRWSLGATREERSYRSWCLGERLFLNPLNEAYTDSVAATDVLHLPNHAYEIAEVPRFPLYYNLLKQEYVSARYRLYRTIQEDYPDFLMQEVLMLDSGEGQALGHYTEDLRSAFRSSYAIFDKIALFLNDYFGIGLDPRNVNFRKIWLEPSGGEIRPIFRGRPNWPLRGLYFLSKDLFDEDLVEIAEPDARQLAQLRHQVEHRFLSFQHSDCGQSTETHRFVTIDSFQGRTLRLLKMAREALVYVSLAMHQEETLRSETTESDPNRISVPILARRIEWFHRDF